MLDWSRPAVELDRQVRALSPHIGVALRGRRRGRSWSGGRGPPTPRPAIGEIGPPLVVGTGDGGLEILELQPAGKRRMAAAEYLRGLREPPKLAS